ncbi:MCM2 [Hepatospora eriocheir]|uniref:DNA replication licensing factor MCM2 n=1 Tax=Hepatospora eriocheir TaxID=1081669 RepID=A0A1X0QCI9_9MICR|nr:MCM2 [Hepatospora eriocheir]
MQRRRTEENEFNFDGSDSDSIILGSELHTLASIVNDDRSIEVNNQNENLEDIDLLNELLTFVNSNYSRVIRNMAAKNLESIEIDYRDLIRFDLFIEQPEKFLDILSESLTKVTNQYFPSYYQIKSKIYPRVVNVPVVDELRGLRNVHLNKMVRVQGVVTRRSGVFNLFSLVKYICNKCKASIGPFYHNSRTAPSIKCVECQSSSSFTVDVTETVYRDFQKITIQEIPGTVPPGSLPRSKEIYLFNDLIDFSKPGDEVDVCGIYKNDFSPYLNLKNNFPVFSTMIIASSVSKKINKMEMTNEDVKEIIELSKDSNILERLINSVCPSIHGHKNIKTSILLAMVGGNSKQNNSLRIRGDINVLLLGDPSMAKSQFLRYINVISHRAVMATGQGSSGVGLTASVRRDPMLKEWTLEGGALVLADQGICCIDEFDKMNEIDRTSIHEAMEQQSISISKAGIVASLHARCSVVAAANPIKGKYNSALSFSQNVNLSDPILSRFDLLCVVKDNIDEIEDSKIADFIIKNHKMGNNEEETDINQDLLKKYILYAKNNIVPIIASFDIKKITRLYSDLRKESLHSGIPITARHIESIVRISEAFAKLRMSSTVSKTDINSAIDITLNTFLSAQKYSIAKTLRKKFAKYFEENNEDLIIYLLKKMITEKVTVTGEGSINVNEFIQYCKFNEVIVTDNFYKSDTFIKSGYQIENNVIIKRN